MELEQAFPRHRTIRAGDLDVHVAEAGEGSPIVLLHGNPDTHTVWGPVVARLASKYRCIAPDLPGFGGTSAAADYSLDSQAAFVRNLLDVLELPRVHLVVHDVGGPHGLAFASQSPERLASLTIFNTNFFADYRWHFWARVWRTRVLGELAMAITNRPLFVRELRRGSPRMPKEYANHAYGALTRSTKREVLRWYRAMDPEVHAGWDERMLAATKATPKLVLWGDLDPFLPARTADRFGGEVRHFADCGHWMMMEEPEQAAAAIAALVGRIPLMPRLYGKIPHLPGSRTGPSDRHVDGGTARRMTAGARPGDRVIVQEKLDGSCVAIVRRDGAIAAFGRDGQPCATARNDGRRAFAAWLEAHAGRFAWLAEGERVVCEWLAVAHGTRYALPHEPVVALDWFGAGGRRAVLAELRARVDLPLPHVVHDGGALDVEAALALLGVHGFHGALDPAEGLVWRVEAAGAVAAVAKYVRPGKQDGLYLADHTGREPVANAWQDRAP